MRFSKTEELTQGCTGRARSGVQAVCLQSPHSDNHPAFQYYLSKSRNFGICFSILCPEGYWIFSLLSLLISFVQVHTHRLICSSWGRQGVQGVKIQKVVHGKSLEQGGRKSIKCIFSVPFVPTQISRIKLKSLQ